MAGVEKMHPGEKYGYFEPVKEKFNKMKEGNQ